MHKTAVYINQTAQINQDNIIRKLEHAYYYQPKTEYKGGSIKWFDDSKLIKN